MGRASERASQPEFPPIYQSINQSIIYHLYIHSSIHPSVGPSIHQPIHPSSQPATRHPSIQPCMHPSISPYLPTSIHPPRPSISPIAFAYLVLPLDLSLLKRDAGIQRGGQQRREPLQLSDHLAFQLDEALPHHTTPRVDAVPCRCAIVGALRARRQQRIST